MRASAKRTPVPAAARLAATPSSRSLESDPAEKGGLGRIDKFSLGSEDRAKFEARVADLISGSLQRTADIVSDMAVSLGATVAKLQAGGDQIDRQLAETQAVLERLIAAGRAE